VPLLEKARKPSLLIVLALDRDWRTSEIAEDMEHTVTAIAYYYPPDDRTWVGRKTEIIAKSIPFSELQPRLDGILQEVLAAIYGFSPESIVRSGVLEENLQFTFRDYYEGGEGRT
jgi:hypothetical protein